MFTTYPQVQKVSAVLYAVGNKVVTDVTANNGLWTFLCAQWSSSDGHWAVFQDAALADEGKGLSKGETIHGQSIQGWTMTKLDVQLVCI